MKAKIPNGMTIKIPNVQYVLGHLPEGAGWTRIVDDDGLGAVFSAQGECLGWVRINGRHARTLN